tara:strand:+ start:3524 stop:4354 length:831 start_codon:yes stop_codon:yes gene_type:complete
MKIKEFNGAMNYLTRSDTRTPEVKKAAAEKQFNADLERKNKLKKSYEIPEDTSPVMYDQLSNSFKTENELKKNFQQEDMKRWVKNTTALNQNPGAFNKAVKESEKIENLPGYDVSKDPNLYRRIKMYSDEDFGPGFDKAIDDEDKALKKLGRDPMNILQRNNIKPFNNNDKSTYPSNPEQRRKLDAIKKTGEDKIPIRKKPKPIVKKDPITNYKEFKIDPIISDPYSALPPEPNDPYLDELEARVKANQEMNYQEKVRNNSSGLRFFNPIKVYRND